MNEQHGRASGKGLRGADAFTPDARKRIARSEIRLVADRRRQSNKFLDWRLGPAPCF
jgi:hypothetical protein